MKRVMRAAIPTIGAVVALALLAVARPASAQMTLYGAKPTIGWISDTRDNSFRWLSGADLTRQLKTMGMPLEIWGYCHGAWFDCVPGDTAGAFQFKYSWGWEPSLTWADPLVWNTRLTPSTTGGIAGFSCSVTNGSGSPIWTETFACQVGTGGPPGWSWIFTILYTTSF